MFEEEEIKDEMQEKKPPQLLKTKKNSSRYFNAENSEYEVKEFPVKKLNKKKQFHGDIINVSLKEKKLPWSLKKHKIKKPKVDKKLLEKHSRGDKAEESGVKTNFFKDKLKRKEIYLEYANEQAARTEILLNEQHGFIEPDEGERTVDFRQEEIVKNVDITAATKHFKLNLDFGPYRFRYTKNGRHLLLGGRKGHVAAFDWITKRLHCEFNVMEEIADVSWLHIETMFACAQKNWVYFYDNKGTEIHCVKRLFKVNAMEFLPYHFLLATASEQGYLSWLDVSIGELVGNFNTKLGDIRLMRNNPANGVICVGGGNGVVSMWSPKVREPIAKMLCHSTPMSALTIDPKGKHLVTSGLDRAVKIWDIRDLKGPLAVYNLKLPVNQIEVSQRGVLAYSMGNVCEIHSSTIIDKETTPYLRQRCGDFIHDLRFCPYEDVLGVSTGKGFTSLLVPGSGEPNFDAFEANPYQTKSQRRENEVHALLEKIPPELITLDPSEITGVDVRKLKDKVEDKKKLFFVKPPQIDFKSRRKMKGKGGSVNAAKNKQIVKDLKRKEFITEIRQQKKDVIANYKITESNNGRSDDFIPLETPKSSVLDRFKSKKL